MLFQPPAGRVLVIDLGTLLGGLAGIPLGVYALAAFSTETMRILIGAMTLAAAIIMAGDSCPPMPSPSTTGSRPPGRAT